MDYFKQASKEKLRFQTNKGLLSVEQLWDLNVTDLDTLAVQLQAEYEQSAKKSFLILKSAKDRTAKLRFDIALDILITKVEENNAAVEAKERRAHNQKIDSLIAEKQEEGLKSKSIHELEMMKR